MSKNTTCYRQLREMVDSYADDATNGNMLFYPGDDEDPKYEAYSLQYTINGDGTYLGVKVMLAGGGPTVWLDTYQEEICGYWGSDKYTRIISDFEYIDEYWEDMYKCLS
mgnify:FL=1|jgi:hypothetical protein